MSRNTWIVCIMSILGVLMFSAVFLPVSGITRATEYNRYIIDNAGDVTGDNYAAIEDDADIISIGSELDGETMILELTVKGLIDYNFTSGNRRYYFYMDINADGYPDWRVVKASSSDNANIMNDAESENYGLVSEDITSENFSGNGTDTFKIMFPISIISSNEEITGWNLAGKTDHDDGQEAEAFDYAPDRTMCDRWMSDIMPDPATETPTDTSINVEIKDVIYSVEEQDNSTSMDIKIAGTTSGVNHCTITFIEYYKDGSYSDYEWIYSFDMAAYTLEQQMYMKDMGIEEYHFRSTSGDTWETWEYRVKSTTEGVDTGESDYDRRACYVRAFSDADETKWNQAFVQEANGGEGEAEAEAEAEAESEAEAEGEGEPEGTKFGPFLTNDGKPIDDAAVKVDPVTGGDSYVGLTDAAGYAILKDTLPAGEYKCKIVKAGKVVIDTNLTMTEDDSASYDGEVAPPKSNYDSSEIPSDPGDDKKDEDDSGFLPGFEIICVLGAISIALVLYRRNR